MILFKIIYLCLIVLAGIIPAKHALHMFQQNRYEPGRFTVWIEDNIEGGTKRAAIPSIVILVFAFFCMHLDTNTVLFVCCLIALLLAVYLFLKERKASYIKPLKYTGRVIRQIIVLSILYLLFEILFLLMYRRMNLWLMLAFSYFGPWILIYPMSLLTSPIESMVKKWYINDAKRILNEHTGLTKIGITGSYGKTSTKNVIQSVVSEQFNSLMTPASFNTPMGITITIRSHLKPIHNVFVCEMGADHVGDITELMEFVQPQIGVVTSVGPQHLSTFGTQENITKEKMQMIERLPSNGLGVLNYDNPFIKGYQLENNVPVLTYGIQETNVDYHATQIEYGPYGSKFIVEHNDEKIPFETKLLGELNILNILSAIVVARHLNVPWPTIQKGVRTMKQVEHRLEMKRMNGRTFIDDAFNANPSGAKMSLDVLSLMPGKRVIVTPGMIELGDKQDEINRAFGAQMKDRTDLVILVGLKQTRAIYEGLQLSGYDMKNVHVVETVKDAFQIVYQSTDGKDTILLENDLPDAFNH